MATLSSSPSLSASYNSLPQKQQGTASQQTVYRPVSPGQTTTPPPYFPSPTKQVTPQGFNNSTPPIQPTQQQNPVNQGQNPPIKTGYAPYTIRPQDSFASFHNPSPAPPGYTAQAVQVPPPGYKAGYSTLPYGAPQFPNPPMQSQYLIYPPAPHGYTAQAEQVPPQQGYVHQPFSYNPQIHYSPQPLDPLAGLSGKALRKAKRKLARESSGGDRWKWLRRAGTGALIADGALKIVDSAFLIDVMAGGLGGF
jgi:hypothetical protein